MRLHRQQALHIELAGTQCRAKRQERRADQHHQLVRRSKLLHCQRGRQQAPFMQASLRLQQFNQRALRPAAAGQHLIKSGVTGINRLQDGAAQLAGTPYMTQGSKVGQGGVD